MSGPHPTSSLSPENPVLVFRRRTIFTIQVSLLIAAILAIVVGVIAGWPKVITGMSLGIPINIGSIWLARKGRLRAAALILMCTLNAMGIFLVVNGSGVHDLALMVFPIVLITASLILDRRDYIVIAIVTLVSITGVSVAEMSGRLRTDASFLTTPADTTMMLALLVLIAVALYLLSSSLLHSLDRAYQLSQQQAALTEQAELRTEHLTTLNRISATITSGLQLDQVLMALYRSTCEIAPVNAFYVALYDRAQQLITFPFFMGHNGMLTAPPNQMSEKPGLTGLVIQRRATLYLPNVQDPRTESTHQVIWAGPVHTNSYVGIPLFLKDEVIGILSVQSDQIDAYRPDQIALLETIASQAAIAIENARLFTALQDNERRLEQRVAERTEELEHSNRELESFAYSVAHDLKAPLRGIDGYSHLLLDEYYDHLDEDGRTYLTNVRRAAQQMGGLIEDLLLLSRITRASIHPQPLDLTGLSREILEELQESEPHRRACFDLQPGLQIIADEHLARLALDNLLRNAWKFTRNQAETRIELGSQDQSGETVVYLKDNGIGFDMKYASRLFDAFTRLHDQREFEGDGIGLAITARVIQRHGGRIWAEGAPDSGATFYFTFPEKSQAIR